MKLLTLLLLLGAAARAQTFTLEGELRAFEEQPRWVRLYYSDGGRQVRDSLRPDSGRFRFGGPLTGSAEARLSLVYEGMPEAEGEEVTLFIDPAPMKFRATNTLMFYKLSGSAAQDAFIGLQGRLMKAYMPAGVLMRQQRVLVKAGKKDSADLLQKRIEAYMTDSLRPIFVRFVGDHRNSPVALYAIHAIWEERRDTAAVMPLWRSLSGEVRASGAGKAFSDKMDRAALLSVGRQAPDFTQNDTLNRPVKLSQYRGKYVLVDFWASWCGPCRQENPNVLAAFEKYKGRQFTVLGVALERPDDRDKWLEAIRKDGLAWTQVSDLKFWNNEVAKQYGVESIPQNFLIGPDGRILARNLRGEDLALFLEKTLPK